MRTFRTEEVLREAHNKVARVEKSDREDEVIFAERISKAVRLCRHVFSKDGLINYYSQGFRRAVREIVSHQVRQMPQMNREVSLRLVRLPCRSAERSASW